MTDFSTLPLSPALQPGLDALGYTTLTPVQAQSLPAILDLCDLVEDGRQAGFYPTVLELVLQRAGHAAGQLVLVVEQVVLGRLADR